MTSQNSYSSPPTAHYNSRVPASCIQPIIQLSHPNQAPTQGEALHSAITEAILQSSDPDVFQVFQSPHSIFVSFNHEFRVIPPQPLLSRLYIPTKVQLTRSMFALHRLGSKIREVTIGSNSFSVSLDNRSVEDSCYMEYVSNNECWRASSTVPPSGVDLRLVQENELTEGCQLLITIAGCVFKTAVTTPKQHQKPIDIPPRCLKTMMHSLGFCAIHTGSLFKIFASRIGRSIRAFITLTAIVNQHGASYKNRAVLEGIVLKTSVQLGGRESVSNIIHKLREQSRNSVITTRGLEAVGKNLSGCGSIILI